MIRILAAIFVLALTAPAIARTACEQRTFEGARFTVCRYDPQTDKISIAWRNADGVPLMGFAGLKAALKSAASQVKFAVNAGMFHLGGRPVGLFVANGVQETQLNINEGPGNFHLLPNGVFWIDRKGRAFVDDARAFPRRGAEPVLATQSGPMLLIHGKLHPKIQDDGPSKLIRNGVGEAGNGRAVFAISETPVSFGKMARFFRDEMGLKNALFLDGSVSSLWDPANSRMDIRAPLGPLIWVY